MYTRFFATGAIAMQPACPYCGVILPVMPKRKTKCKDCGSTIFVKCTPDNRTKRLMTESQANDVEAQWATHSERESLRRDAETIDLSSIKDREDLQFHARTLAFDESADPHRRKTAAYLLFRKFSHSLEERLRWAMLAETMSILLYASAFTKFDASGQIEILGGDSGCAICGSLTGRKYSIEEAFRDMPLPPIYCPRIATGCGCCCTWAPVIKKY